MGNVRYPVECPGCSAGIILRLGVGYDSKQPFFYVCPVCKAATRGALLWDGGSGTKLELKDGRALDSEQGCSHTVSIHPDLPALATATGLGQPGGSAFLTFFGWLGLERTQLFLAATEQMRHFVDSDWGTLSRLTTYYVHRNWPHFDATLATVMKGDATPDLSSAWKRDHYICFLYDMFLSPVLALDLDENYPNLKASYNALWKPDSPGFNAVVAFAKAEYDTTHFVNSQRDLFDCIGRYVNLISALMPGLLCNLLPATHQHEVDDLRLFRDEYELLRDLYIQSFEAAHKALRWIVGAANANHHGDHNHFVAVPGMSKESTKKLPADLDAYSDLTSFLKRQWLAVLPEWNNRWDSLLDRKLRNDIGHASARHDLPTGMILRDGKPPLTYTRFVQMSQRVIYALLSVVNALKIVRIYALM